MYTFCHNFVPPIRFGGYSSKNADLILAWGARWCKITIEGKKIEIERENLKKTSIFDFGGDVFDFKLKILVAMYILCFDNANRVE